MEIKEKNIVVTTLLNAALSSIETVIPIENQIQKPKLLKDNFQIDFGVLIGIVGDLEGKLVFSGNTSTFASIGKGMYGMPLNGEMLQSFSAELGNMIAGSISTNLSKNNTDVIISTPTILQGETILFGYKQALELSVSFKDIGHIKACLLLD